MTLISTGLPSLNTLLGGGLQPGTLTIVAGRSQSGMTTMLDTICCAAAFRDQVPTVLADLETSAADRMLRLASALSDAPLAAMQRFQLDPDDAARVRDTERQVTGAPFWFADDTNTVGGLRRALTQHEPPARLLLVDGTRFLTDPTGPASALRYLADARHIAVVATQPVDWDGGHIGHAMRNLPAGMVGVADNIVLLHRPICSGAGSDGVGVTVTGRHGNAWFPLTADFEHARLTEAAPHWVTTP
ncbi:DnaB-like helicase C-terminal domain-containing protein [Micromonospora sp. WMMD737]|uniref:DnaB-like helicase C-terminal domain-containing protein n=1 Tax=Micromonospora sp. WMMD737 TaxID=3404113 RepID=UPI003B93135C